MYMYMYMYNAHAMVYMCTCHAHVHVHVRRGALTTAREGAQDHVHADCRAAKRKCMSMNVDD